MSRYTQVPSIGKGVIDRPPLPLHYFIHLPVISVLVGCLAAKSPLDSNNWVPNYGCKYMVLRVLWDLYEYVPTENLKSYSYK